MKKFRVLALVLSAVLLVGVLAGCSTSASEITVTLKFTTNDGTEFFNQEIKVNTENPTVESVVNEANVVYTNLGITWSDRFELSLADLPDTQLEDGTFMYWEFTINGEEVEGVKANTAAVKDGDVISYTYTAFVPEETAAG